MNLISLILFVVANLSLVLWGMRSKGGIYQFPFWAGAISLGWFFPQAIGGFLSRDEFPLDSYSDSMFFAILCIVAIWVGFVRADARRVEQSWLDAKFDLNRLYWAGVFLCLFGFFFQWKLWSLPEEMLAETQWSGAAVKYLFFASLFKVGFLTLWLIYLSQGRLFSPRLLIFIVPCLLVICSAALLRGRRAEMMNLVSYILVSLWFVRRISIPRGLLITGLAFGIVLVNAIGTYRAIMKDKEVPIKERLAEAANADYLSQTKESMDESGSEFKNYIFYRQAITDTGFYDYGLKHWDRLVFNFVPAQIVGREVKEALMLDFLEEVDIHAYAAEEYGHPRKTGSTSTGFYDAFASFGWFGFIKFLLIGSIMGALHRHAMQGAFLAQMLYVYTLGTAMHAISHGTHRILASTWVYFFMLGYPVFYLAMARDRAIHESAPMSK